MGAGETSSLSEDEKRANLIRLVFGGDEHKLEQFCDVLRRGIPDNIAVIVRGSAITGERWKDKAPFDHDGPGTSDLDLTLVGEEGIRLFTPTGFFVPGVHSRPVSERDPDIAPTLIPLRETLMALVGRPVNIQASRDVVIHVRGDLFGQPYFVLISKPDLADPLGLES